MPPIFKDMMVVEIGDPNAQNKLTVVSNPYCGPCARAHLDLEALIKNYKNILCQYVFLGSPDSMRVAQIFLNTKKNEVELAMNIWFNGRLSNKTIWPNTKIPSEAEKGLADQIILHKRWSELANINATPTIFLNGVEIPEIYSITDISKVTQHAN